MQCSLEEVTWSKNYKMSANLNSIDKQMKLTIILIISLVYILEILFSICNTYFKKGSKDVQYQFVVDCSSHLEKQERTQIQLAFDFK